MKRLSILLAVLILVTAVAPTCVFAAESKAVVDMDKTYQTIDGFGAGYTWYSNWLLKHEKREEMLDEIFNECKFNIFRFINPQENGTSPASISQYKQYYDEAVERGIDPLVMVTHCGAYVKNYDFSEFVTDPQRGTTYYRIKKDENGEYMYDVFAKHCVEAVKSFMDAGVPVHYFSFANEVEWQEKKPRDGEDPLEYSSFFWGTEETEYQPSYTKAHAAIVEAFEKEFGENAPEVMGAEAMNGNANVLKKYLDPLRKAHPEMLKTVAFHLYGTNATPKTFKAVYEAFPDLKHWQTEYCMSDYFRNGEIIVDELLHGNLNAYIYWNGVWANDGGQCLIELQYSSKCPVKYNGSHYIMKHFSKFIERGYQRVDISHKLGSKLVAFKSPDNKKLVVVASNSTSKNETLTLDCGYKILSSEIYQSTEGETADDNKYFTDLGEYDGSIELPANSLTTAVFDLKPKYTGETVIGDVDVDGSVTNADAIYLLYHTIFGDEYPVEQNCDFDASGEVNNSDAIYLLYHTIFGDLLYPLK